MRCPDCNKFVSFDEPTTEILNEEVEASEGGGFVSCEVSLTLPCAECGTELKGYSEQIDMNFDHECDPEKIKKDAEEGYTVEFDEPEASDDYRPKTDKKGKTVPFRYQKHFYDVSVVGTVTCNKCGETITVDGGFEAQASSFDEMV